MRIDDISPATTAHLAPGQWISGKALCVAISADGVRGYLGGHSGVWRSDDGGVTWWHPEWPQPAPGATDVPGALVVPNVHDVLIAPNNNDIVLAATGYDARSPEQNGIYRSLDGAQSWSLVHQFTGPWQGLQRAFMASQFAVAPDDPNLIFAAGGFALAVSGDGGATWTDRKPQATAGELIWHVAVGPLVPPVAQPARPRVKRRVAGGVFTSRRRVYAVGSAPSGSAVWYSEDGGDTWRRDPVALQQGAASVGALSAHALAVHPADARVLYLTMRDGSIWRGRYDTAGAPGNWEPLPPPPIIPGGPGDSGGNFIVPHVTADGQFYLFASDRRTVNVSVGDPSSVTDWTRIEDSHCHGDPHDLALTPDFRLGLSGAPGGRALLVNDGGVNVSTDGANNWSNGAALSTLNVVNVAVNTVPGKQLICFGTGDNDGFCSPDGGATWQTQDYRGGDNDCSFSDPMQPTRMLVFAPRSVQPNGISGEIWLYVSNSEDPSDVAHGSQRRRIPGPENLPVADPGASPKAGWNAVSSYVAIGYRPIVLTVPGEPPRADGDLIVIKFTLDAALLMRTTKLSTIVDISDWVTDAGDDGPGVKVFQVGPPLPVNTASVVQASGGHDATVYYVGDPFIYDGGDTYALGQMRLWKWTAGFPAWLQLIPRTPTRISRTRVQPILPGPTIARRFFVDPYRPNLIYVLGADHIYRSEDGGGSWGVDAGLERMLTADGAFGYDEMGDENPFETLLRDMQFDPFRPGCRFAAGPAGVFYTVDGLHWDHALVSESVAIRPTSVFYDYRSCARALYVGTNNRGLLRVSPVPPDWDYPLNSLQVAQGRVALLRVHDPGTGYGPADDQLDADVIVWLDSEPEKAFGFQLRPGDDQSAGRGKLKLLRDAFNGDRRIRLEFIRTGCRTAKIVRVIDAR